MLGCRVRGQQSPNPDNAKIRLYTKSSRLRLLLLTRLRRRKNARRKNARRKNARRKKRKGAKARRRKEERRKKKGRKREEEGGRKERSVSHPSFSSCSPSCFSSFLCGFASLHLCVKFRLILSVFSATSAGLLSYLPSVRARCGTSRSEASARTWMPSRSQGRSLWVRSPRSRPAAARA